MSSDVHRFVKTLQSVGYKPATEINLSSVEWIFDTRAAPFLVWFSTSVGQSNFVNREELKAFTKLKEEGVGLLEADQVEKILVSTNYLNQDSELVSKEMLRHEVHHANDDKKMLQKRKEALVRRRRLLSARLASLKNNFFKMENSRKKGQQAYYKSQRLVQAANKAANASFGGLKQSVKLLSIVYEESGYTERLPQDKAVFLCQINLRYLQKLEDRFIQEVTNYCKKQFFEGIANVAGHNRGSQYSMMEIDDPKTELLRGDNVQSCKEYSKEFTQLKAIYPDMESSRVMSCAEVSCQKAIRDEALVIRKEAQGLYWRLYKSILRSQLQENQISFQMVMLEQMYQIEEVMPRLIEQSTGSFVLPIITGNYNLKLVRQDYFSDKQDKIIKYIVIQRSRNEFLSMAYDIENRNHRGVGRLLRALYSKLFTWEQSCHERMAMMNEMRLDPTMHQRATIDYRDTNLLRLHSVLASGPEDLNKLYQKLSSLVEWSGRLSQKINSAQSAPTNLYFWHEQILRLKMLLKKCDRVMYCQSTRTAAQPQLTTYPIRKTHRQLDNLLNQVGVILKGIISEVDQKKQILKCCPGKRAERELYEFFLLSPDRLHMIFNKLHERLLAKRTR